MNKPNLSSISKGIRTALTKHSPEILTGIGITGMITTTVLAVRATPRAVELISDLKKEQLHSITQEQVEELHKNGEVDLNPITAIDIVKATWKCYIPAAITGSLSVICLIGASSVNVRRNAALATAYTLSESALKEYQEKVVEQIGEKKEQAVRDAIAKDKLEQDPVTNREVIITEKGDTLCYDALSGRYFKSDIDKIKKAVNEINRNLLGDMYISLNDFYYELGLDNTKLGDELGWNVDNGLIDLNFSSQLASDGTPCLVINYQVAPKYDYYK